MTTYSYDTNGNRTMTGYTPGANNQLTSDGTFTYTYDANGNMTEKSKGTGLETWYYTYDNLNHLLSVKQTSNGTTTIMYEAYTNDVYGNVIKEVDTLSGVTTTIEHVFKGTTLVMDLTSTSTVQMRYLAGSQANEWLGRQDGSGTIGGIRRTGKAA